MKLGLINSAWVQANQPTVFGLRKTKEIGFDSIDIFVDPLEIDIRERRLIKNECDRLKLPIISIASVAVGLIDFNPTVRKFHESRVRTYLDLAYEYEAKNVLLVIGEYIWNKEVIPPEEQWHPTESCLAAPADEYRATIELCQALGPAAPYPISGLDCASGACGELGWADARPIAWQSYAQGEYVGHARTAHVAEYRLRVDDVLDFVFRLTRQETQRAYRLKVGDQVRVELLADPELASDVEIQPDGMITLRLVGLIRAARLTIGQLRDLVEERYREFYNQPTVTITPLKLNSRLEDLRASVDRRFGSGGQTRRAKVTPEGTVQLPLIHSVSVQGLTLVEAQREIERRYAEHVEGMEITPVLITRAPRYVYVLGEVRFPGRYELVAPTTIMQAIALAGGWNYGGNLWNTVIFRRGDDWRLMATRVDLRGSLYGKRPCPADELWINDSDVVVVPKSGVLVAQNIVSLVFAQGIFRVVPFHAGFNYNTLRFRGTAPSLAVIANPGLTPIVSPAVPAAPAAPAPPAVTPPPAPSPTPTPPIPLPQS